MKTLKSLLMLCAGLSFCACNSDNEPQLPEGKGAVTVKIVNPVTRAAQDVVGEATTGNTVNVNGSMTITLYHSLAPTGTEKIVDLNSATQEVTFYNVGAPSRLTAQINGGVDDYSEIEITGGTPELQVEPASIPVFGETSDFELDEDDLVVAEGVNAGTYKKYTAAVDLKIPVARLEVQIAKGDLQQFGSVKVLGAYLDGILPTAGGSITDYYLEGDDSDYKSATDEDNPYAILSYKYDAPYDLASASYVPGGEDDFFRFNFYAPNGTANPKFKLLLQVDSKEGEADIPQYQYAIIEKFVTANGGSTEVDMTNGNIYKVTNLSLNSSNIQLDESGEDIAFALVATVTRANWSVIPAFGQWGQGE